MGFNRRTPLGPACLAFLLTGAAEAQPTPDLQRLQGAWVPEGDRCESVFYRQGTSVLFARPGAAKRDGILVQGNRMQDARHGCTISKVNASAATYSLLLTCFSGLLVSKLSFSIRFLDDDTVVRTHAEFPDEEMRFRRCRL